jgi:arginase family enzyme
LARLDAALNELFKRVPAVYLHLDLDVLDPALSPGVNFQAPGGIKPEELWSAVEQVRSKIPIAAATIANFNPDRDQEDRTLRIALKLVEILQ